MIVKHFSALILASPLKDQTYPYSAHATHKDQIIWKPEEPSVARFAALLDTAGALMPQVEGLDMDRRNKHPRLLSEPERARLEEFVDSIHYSSRS